MLVKLLSPIFVGVFIFFLMIGVIVHLCFWDCQTSKWHYICQSYWMPNGKSYPYGLDPYKNFTGIWVKWDSKGRKTFEGEFYFGVNIKKHIEYNQDGVKTKENYYSEVDGQLISTVYRDKVGVIYMFDYLENGIEYKSGYRNPSTRIMKIIYKNRDGSLNKKEYFNEDGGFLKSELFENNKLIQTGVIE